MPARLLPPGFSDGLRRAVELVRLDEGRHLPGVSPAQALEARDLLPVLRDLCRPGTADVVDAWMDRVFVSVGNPPNGKGKVLRVASLLGVSGDLPRACWTVETFASYVRHYGEKADWWPGPGMVDSFLRPIGRELDGQRRAMERIVLALAPLGTPPAPPEDLTAADRARITGEILAKWGIYRGEAAMPRTVAEQIAEVAVKQAPRPSRYPTPDQLRAMRAAGRQRMGLPPLPGTPGP